MTKESSKMSSDSSVIPVDSPTVIVGHQIKDKGIVEAYILGLSLGLFGAHHFYLRRPGWGCLYLFTLGLLGVGYIVDLFRMVVLVRRANEEYAARGDSDMIQQKYLDDAYIAWLPMGLLGAHHFYLRNIGWGVAYLFTFGFMGIGWMIDAICMYKMVQEFNCHQIDKHAAAQGSSQTPVNKDGTMKSKRLTTAYRLWAFPFTGLLGAHHYYMGRIAFGLFYTFTLGGLGLGWFCDLFRMSCLLQDANKRREEDRGLCANNRERRLDDLYIMMIPFGLVGAHHFHLRRVGWGFLYLFTLGCLGIGWLVDFFRLPSLIKQHREQIRKQCAERHGAEQGGVDNYGATSNSAGDISHDSPGDPAMATGGVAGPVPGVYHVPPVYPGFTGYPAPGYNSPAYPDKTGGINGLPPSNLPPPEYDESAMSSFSTVASSNVDGLPSYQDAILENMQNNSNMAVMSRPAPLSAPPADSK